MPNAKRLNFLQLIWKWHKSAVFGWICTAATTFPLPGFFPKLQEGAHTWSYQVWQKSFPNFKKFEWNVVGPNLTQIWPGQRNIVKNSNKWQTCAHTPHLWHIPIQNLGFWHGLWWHLHTHDYQAGLYMAFIPDHIPQLQFNPIQSYFWLIFCSVVQLTNTSNFTI